MPVPRQTCRYDRLLRAGMIAGLVALTLISGGVMRKSFALAQTAWQGGQYRDTSTPPAAGRPGPGPSVTTRAAGKQLALGETAVQRPRLQPGEAATLRAVYEVPEPSQVRETRVIRYDGLVLARIERVIARPGGSVLSEYRVDVPRDAVDGWYAVTTTVERMDATTRGGPAEQKETGFFVDTKAATTSGVSGGAATSGASPSGASASGTVPSGAPPSGASSGVSTGAPAAKGADDGIAVKLWTEKTRYRVGERLALSFETNRDAFLTIVNVGTSGEVTILFPNRFSGGHGVKAGRTYRIPETTDSYELELKGPPGVELVYALLTLKPVLFLATDFPSAGAVFPSTADRVSRVTRDINVAAKSIPLREQARAMIELEVSR
jgi:hypothetical protein